MTSARREPLPAKEKLQLCANVGETYEDHRAKNTFCFLELFKGLCHLRPNPLLVGGASRYPARQPGLDSPLPSRKLLGPTHPRRSKPRSLKAESARRRNRSGAMFAFWRHGRGSAPSWERPAPIPAGDSRGLSPPLLSCTSSPAAPDLLIPGGRNPGQGRLKVETTLHCFVARRRKEENILPWFLAGNLLPLSQAHH